MILNQSIFIFAPGVLAGAERVVLTGINALYDLGVPTKIIVIKETRAPKMAENFTALLNPNIPVEVVIATGPLDFSLRSKIKKLLETESGSTIIHSHGFKALFYSYFAFSKCPLVHTHHGNTTHTFSVRMYEFIANKIMKRCHHVIAVSEKMRNELLDELVPFVKISTIENMLSIKNAEEIRKKRLEYKRDIEKIELIYIGRLSPEKGLLEFLTYFNKYHNREKFHLNVLGDGPDYTNIATFIKENNLQHLVSLNGFVTEQSQFLIKADLLILPSFKEGLPMTLIEAMAVGLPVLANDVGAISTLVNNDTNGLLIKEFTEKNWQISLDKTLLSNRDWCLNAMKNAEHIETKYSSKSWAKKTLELYKSQ